MTAPDESFREQLVSYLYGELQGEALRSFEAQLAASESARRELAALQRTLHLTRAARADLLEEPPARGREALLRAAAAGVREDPPARGSNEQTVRRLVRPLRWLAPTLAVAAAALLLVVKRGEDAGEHPLRRPEPATHEPAAAPSEELGATEAPPAARALPSEARGPSTEYAEPPGKHSVGSSPEAKGSGARGVARTRSATRPRSLADAPTPEARSEPVPDVLAQAGSRAPARAPVPAAAPKREFAAAPSEARAEEEGARVAKPASSAGGSAAEGAAQLLARAREHTAAGRYAQAVALYRQLLERFPDHPRAALFRSELARARALAEPGETDE